MLHLLSHFPLGYHFRNALRFSQPSSVAFWIHNTESVSALYCDGKNFSFDANIERHVGAPSLFSPPSTKTPFQRQVLAPQGLARDARMVFLIDHPDTIISLVQTKKLGVLTIAQLRKTPVEAFLPLSAPADSFSWEILTPDFQQLPQDGPTPESVIVVGLPHKLCWWAEKWVETLGGILLNILPSLLAELHWCRARTPAFVLLPGPVQSYLAVFEGQKLHILARVPSAETITGSLIDPMIEEIRLELNLQPSPLGIYNRSLSANQLQALLSRFRVPCVILNPEPGSPCVTDHPVEASVLHAAIEASLP